MLFFYAIFLYLFKNNCHHIKFMNKWLINFARMVLPWHQVCISESYSLYYAPTKKIRESAIDESNSVVAQQREGRRRRYVNESALLNESTGSSKTDRLASTRLFVCSFFGRIAKIAGLCKYSIYPSETRQRSSIFHGRYNAKMFSKRRENRTR